MQLLIAFNLGLFSTLHCLGMCGGILSALMFLSEESNASQKRLALNFGYNIGRIISYSIAGLMAAFLTHLIIINIAFANPHLILQIISAVVLIGIALNILGVLPFNTYLEKTGRKLWQYIQPFGKHFLPVNSFRRALLFGMLWGWLPCGMVYSALILAMSTGDAIYGLLTMLCFGLGTLPGMVSAGYFSSALIRLRDNKKFRLLTGLMLIILAISLPLSAIYFSEHHSDQNAHAHHHLH
jgi:sulfite exporter TauE/SafE